MSNYESSNILKAVNSDNYLINCYLSLTKIKAIHFLFIFIEIMLNLIQELEIFHRGFKPENTTKNNTNLNYILYITNIFQKLPMIINLIIIIILITILDLLYYFIKLKKFKTIPIYIIIIINIIEIFFFRTISLIFFNLFFTLQVGYLLVGFIFLFPHLILLTNNFLNNHLYYFVPEFINYPYDEFSSLFDIILLFSKLLLSIAGTTTNLVFGKFCFYTLFILQNFFCLYFIHKLKYQSYLFMKNSFLNRTKFSLFLTKTIINIFAVLFGRNGIYNILFFIISFILLLVVMIYMYFAYNPFYFIKINEENQLENMFFYLFILSEKNDYEFIIENKINEHFENCGICNLCYKYEKYKCKKNSEDDEKEKFINNEENILKKKNSNQFEDIFDILYDGKNKYFILMKKLIINYKNRGKESLRNNPYYYISLSYLIFSDFEKKNIILSLNERIIMEVINNENLSFLDNHETQINQLLLCNSFISLSHKILNQFKDIINSEPNFKKVQKIIDLSLLLKEMNNQKFKKSLFSHKSENISNSRYLILICSIIYEEIFNTKLNNSQFPIRDNLQPLEDIFYHNSNKINKIISLRVDLLNRNCRIIRAGQGLYSEINNNLFDLFPLIFKEFQINLFMSSILSFENNSNEEKNNNDNNNKKNTISNVTTKKKFPRKSAKHQKGNKSVNNNKTKNEYIEIRLIISENISSKMFYKLLTLKITPLFNNDNSHFILFDGQYFLHKNTVITLQDFDVLNSKEKLLAVSEPKLEKKTNESFKKYLIWQDEQGFTALKISSFNICNKLYRIYQISKKNIEMMKRKLQRKTDVIKNGGIESDEEEEQASINKNMKKDKTPIVEDNASVASQQTGHNFSAGISGVGVRNKKSDNIYNYGGFNKIKKIIILIIAFVLISLIIEHFYLNSLENDTYNNNISLLEYRQFYKLYFQLFSSILEVACIFYKEDCIILTDIFTEKYNIENYENFNYTLFVSIQNEILSKKLLEKRSNLANIHKCIGNKKYNKLFGKGVEYTRISQNSIQGKVVFNISLVKIDFSEAILIICNSFQLLSNFNRNPILFLNKISDDPFKNLNNNENEYLNDFQKEFYEMVLNYKLYYREFNSINEELEEILLSKSNYIQIFIYIYLSFNLILILAEDTSVYIYCIFFENILIKIINYINMTLNIKNDDFNFSMTFSQKIENLENLLQFDENDPVKAVQSLNNLYTNHQQYLEAKNKINANESNKKNYKKIIDENKKNELDNISKSDKIMTKKDISTLGITFIYKFFYFFNFVFFVICYLILIIVWFNYFSKKSDLYTIIQKNISLESSIYRAINVYGFMIFHNYTIDETTEQILSDFTNDTTADKNALVKSFYYVLKSAFNSQKEKNKVGELYQDFEDLDFNCENLYNLNDDDIKKIENNSKANDLPNIKENLIKFCKYSRVTESNNFINVFERHFQNIRNGILGITDFSIEGLIDHIKIHGPIPRISVIFNCIIIYVLEITIATPCENSINKLISSLKNYVLITEIIFIIFNIIAALFIIFLFIKRIDNLCHQIFGLRKIFKIFELQE